MLQFIKILCHVQGFIYYSVLVLCPLPSYEGVVTGECTSQARQEASIPPHHLVQFALPLPGFASRGLGAPCPLNFFTNYD